MTLSEFLLARIAEDEAAAKACGYWPGILDPFAGDSAEFKTQVLRWNPVRVLAECEAKRRIVDACRVADMGGPYGVEMVTEPCMRALALPFADHPDYDEDWRP